jgi:multidrug efflux pump subunit AcrB
VPASLQDLMQPFKAITQRYVGSVRFLTRHKWVGVLGLLLISVAAFTLIKKTPTGFIPEEDQGFIIAVIPNTGWQFAKQNRKSH